MTLIDIKQIRDLPSPGVSDHTLLTNIGVNTHVQIDAHINNVSNPHGVTKSQVGLGNADNTSDANKPVSIATQAALNINNNDSIAYSIALGGI